MGALVALHKPEHMGEAVGERREGRGERLPGAGDEGGHMLTGRPTLGTEERPAPPSLSFVRPPGSWPGLVREQAGGLTDMAGLQSAVVGGD